jgi:uncharacterized membrane protein
VLDLQCDALIENAPIYSLADYRFGLIVIPICLICATILTMFLKETHPERKLPAEYGGVIDTDVL